MMHSSLIESIKPTHVLRARKSVEAAKELETGEAAQGGWCLMVVAISAHFLHHNVNHNKLQ